MQLKEGEPKQIIPKDEDPVASCVPHCYTQDVSLACCLPPGAYTIVPSAYQPDCSASFTLSLACRIHRLALFPLALTLSFFRSCSRKTDSRSFGFCCCCYLSRICDTFVFCRKVVKSQERLGRAIQEVSLLVKKQQQLIFSGCFIA